MPRAERRRIATGRSLIRDAAIWLALTTLALGTPGCANRPAIEPAGTAAPAALSGDAAAPRPPRTPGDPVEGTNRRFFRAQSGIDRGFFGPVARFYKRVVPRVIRSGLRNIIRNLTEPVVFVNDVLQIKPKRAVRTLGRFVINSTVGVAGAIDVAKTADLPYRANGFGNTLGRYGVGPGPFLYLPLVGPTTLRDLLGGQLDGLVLPVGVGFPFDRLDYQLSRGVVATLDRRAEAEDDLKALLSGAADPYATLRSVYLQSRAAAIAELRGSSDGTEALDDPLLDPAESPPDPTAGAAPDVPEQTDPAACADAGSCSPAPAEGATPDAAPETLPDPAAGAIAEPMGMAA